MNNLFLVVAQRSSIKSSEASEKASRFDFRKGIDQQIKDLKSSKETFMKEFDEKYFKLMQSLKKVDWKLYDPV